MWRHLKGAAGAPGDQEIDASEEWGEERSTG